MVIFNYIGDFDLALFPNNMYRELCVIALIGPYNNNNEQYRKPAA